MGVPPVAVAIAPIKRERIYYLTEGRALRALRAALRDQTQGRTHPSRDRTTDCQGTPPSAPLTAGGSPAGAQRGPRRVAAPRFPLPFPSLVTLLAPLEIGNLLCECVAPVRSSAP